MTWIEMAEAAPAFVQWCVQKYGPLPDGEIVEADYDRYYKAYTEGTTT
jgi:hypothetical protein